MYLSPTICGTAAVPCLVVESLRAKLVPSWPELVGSNSSTVAQDALENLLEGATLLTCR